MVKSVLTVFLFLLALSGSKAEAQGYPQKYSLRQCLDFAINNSYAAHKADLDVGEAGYPIHEARSNVLPQINASGSIDHSIVLPTTMLPGEIIGQPGTQIPVQMGTKNVLDFSASIEQVIFAPTLFTGIKIAKNNRELQRLRATMTKEEIIFDVSNAFYDILNSMQELDNINYMISKQDSLYLLMKKRVEENVTREVDLNRVKVNLTNLQARGQNTKNTILQQRRYLQILIGIPVEDAFELDDSEAKSIEVSELQTYAQSYNKIKIDILSKQKEIVELEIRSQKQSYLPTLSAIATGGYQFQSDNLNLSKEPWFNTVIIGARLSVPVFDGLGKRSRIRQKQMQLQGLDWDIRETQQTLSANYINAKNQLEIICELVQVQSENLQLAEKVYAQTIALYTEGLATITDIFETETSLHEVKIAYTTELIRYKKAEIDLLKASGTLESLLINN
ncbi:MAG: TolC family protein [Dysgonamonadaceae bacterium]|jgi:outer membrane protein TolC|nr:TolC family protein [Dysgonamonadaceae bacterium]